METKSFGSDVPVSHALDESNKLDGKIEEEMEKYLNDPMHGYDRLKSLIFEQERWIKTAAEAVE